jgi:hypothetical protein
MPLFSLMPFLRLAVYSSADGKKRCRRKAKRCSFDRRATGWLDGGIEDSTRPILLIDLSETGLGFSSKYPVDTGAQLELVLSGSVTGKALCVSAKVAHATKGPDGAWIVGCRFAERLSPTTVKDLLGVDTSCASTSG